MQVGSSSGIRASGKAIVPKEQGMMQKLERAAANNPIKKVDGMYVPEGNPIISLNNYI